MTAVLNATNGLIRTALAFLAAVLLTFFAFWGMQKLINLGKGAPAKISDAQIGDFVRIKLPPPAKQENRTIERPPPLMQAPPKMQAPSVDQGGVPSGLASSAFDDGGFDFGGSLNLQAGIGQAGGGSSGLVLQTPINPTFPPAAARRGLEGYVKVKIFVNAQGSVDRVQVVQSQPQGIFDEAAVKAAKKAKFKPQMVNGKPVAAVAKRKIDFNLDRG